MATKNVAVNISIELLSLPPGAAACAALHMLPAPATRYWANCLAAIQSHYLRHPAGPPIPTGPPALADVVRCCELMESLARMGEATIYTAAHTFAPTRPPLPSHAATLSWLRAISPGDL